MTSEVTSFIKSNAWYIDNEEWEELYELAYEWISDKACNELTQMLSTVFDDNFKDIALYVVRKHIATELNNFVADKNHDELYLISFIRLCMNHLCGLSYEEVEQDLITNPVTHPKIKQTIDDGNLLYIKIK